MKTLLASLFITLPFFAFANAGSPIIWLNMFHLLFINAVIGYIESKILSKYKIPNKTWMVIIANYISMILGFFVIVPSLVKTQYGRDFGSGNSGELAFALIVSFIATLIIEYPFFVASLKDKNLKKGLFKPFLIANIKTNIVMICIYLLLSTW